MKERRKDEAKHTEKRKYRRRKERSEETMKKRRRKRRWREMQVIYNRCSLFPLPRCSI